MKYVPRRGLFSSREQTRIDPSSDCPTSATSGFSLRQQGKLCARWPQWRFFLTNETTEKCILSSRYAVAIGYLAAGMRLVTVKTTSIRLRTLAHH